MTWSIENREQKNKQQQTQNSALLDSLYGGAEAFWPVPTWAARLYHSLHSVAIYNSGNHRSRPLEVRCYILYKKKTILLPSSSIIRTSGQ